MAVLFVCLGNICRSPTAEAVLRARRPTWEIDSAGTAAWHTGKPPYGPMQAAATVRGYAMADLRARQVGAADFDRFDHIIAMDGQNLADLRALADDPGEARGGDRGGDRGKGQPVLSRLLDFAPDLGIADVPDPYYTRDFNRALDLIEAGVEGLLRSV